MKAEITQVSPSEASQLASDALLLDVRTPAEFSEAHIAGSVLHPLGSLDAEAVRRLAAGRSSCLVICRSGQRSGQAAAKLSGAGLPGIRVLTGGILAWEAAGLPLKRGVATVISLERQVRIAAGGLALTGSFLAHFVHPLWMILPGFVGAGLVFAGVTDTCGMGMALARMPWNNRRPVEA